MLDMRWLKSMFAPASTASDTKRTLFLYCDPDHKRSLATLQSSKAKGTNRHTAIIFRAVIPWVPYAIFLRRLWDSPTEGKTFARLNNVCTTSARLASSILKKTESVAIHADTATPHATERIRCSTF